MTREQLDREIDFGTSMCVADRLLSQGLITDDEYSKIRRIFFDKHKPLLAGNNIAPSDPAGAEPVDCQLKKP